MQEVYLGYDGFLQVDCATETRFCRRMWYSVWTVEAWAEQAPLHIWTTSRHPRRCFMRGQRSTKNNASAVFELIVDGCGSDATSFEILIFHSHAVPKMAGLLCNLPRIANSLHHSKSPARTDSEVEMRSLRSWPASTIPSQRMIL